MARITNYEESKQFESSTGLPVFSLADDGDSDRVQILLNSLNDVLTYTVHEVPAVSKNGRSYNRKVGCLKQHASDPAGTCPLCDANNKVKLSRFVPLYSVSDRQVVLWERGGQFIEKRIMNLINRAKAAGVDPTKRIIDVTRLGKKGDQQTTYEFYPIEGEVGTDTSSLEIPDPEGTLIAQWSAADMSKYIATGELPKTNNAPDNSQVERRQPRTEDYSGGYDQHTPPAQEFQNATPVTDPTAMF